jgi:hypothetical protein
VFRCHFSYPWIRASAVCSSYLVNMLIREEGGRNAMCGSVIYVFGMAN